MENKNENGFSYTYSAKEQAEIKKIREKYEEREEDGITRLRRLDASVGRGATAVALIFGIIGTLVMGFGFSLVMSDLPSLIGMSAELGMPIGIAIGALGCVLVAITYPLYSFVLKKRRERIAPEILRISEELMK